MNRKNRKNRKNIKNIDVSGFKEVIVLNNGKRLKFKKLIFKFLNGIIQVGYGIVLWEPCHVTS